MFGMTTFRTRLQASFVVVEHPLVFEVDEGGQDEVGSVEEGSHGDLDAGDVLLDLEALDLGGPALAVAFEEGEEVASVVLLAHEGEDLFVLGAAAGLDDVAVGVGAEEGGGLVERREVPARERRHPGGLHLGLAEVAVVFEAVGGAGAADDGLAFAAEFLGGLSEVGVVEDDDVGPVLVVLPGVDLFEQAVGDVLVGAGEDGVADGVAFLEDLEGEVVDEAEAGDEEEFRGGGAHEPSVLRSMLSGS
jgi:hypothetical protein